MDTSGMYPTSEPTQTQTNNPQRIIIAIGVGVLVAIGIAAYFTTKNVTEDTTSSSISVFNSVKTNTVKIGEEDASTLTYLQAHDDEAYCSKFDEQTDGATAAQLSEPAVIKTISDRIGASLVSPFTEKLTTIMNIDNGLFTDLCNHDGDIWTLILSSDLQTMMPYHFTESNGIYSLNAYNPFLTQGGYGSLFFDHVPNTTIAATGYSEEEGLLDWEYYALDGESGATDLIESCNQDARETTIILECAREYVPE